MPAPFHGSLQRRLLALAMRTSGAALVLAGVAIGIYEYAVVRAETRRDVQAQAELLAANCGAAASFADADHAQRLLQSLKSRPQFTAAALFAEDGEWIASWERRPGAHGIALHPGRAAGIVERGTAMSAQLPVVYGDAIVGTLCLEARFSPVGTRFVEYLGLAAIVLSASWLIALWLAMRMQRTISAPVLDLARTAREVTERRDYTVRAARSTDDELGLLADGFNAMLAQIQARDAALQDAHDSLERRVAERTSALQDEVAERRRVEAALADEKERLAVTLRSIGDAVITTGCDGRIVLFNPVAELLSGWSAGEAVGRPLSDILRLGHEKTRTPCGDLVARILEIEAPVDLGELVALRGAGQVEPIVASSGAPIRDRAGRVIGVVLAFRDVTEQHRTTQELLRAGKLESIGVLAGGIAHDFNNILTVIIGNVTLARMFAPPDGTLAEALSAAEKASIRAGDLTRQLLTFAKGGAPVKKTASLDELIRETAGFVLHGSKVACQFSIPADLWRAEIDVGQISQVIHNLVLNAVQAMPDGGLLRIRAKNAEIGEGSVPPLRPGRYVAVSVEDNGPGIAPEHLGRIFDPYFTTKKQGSGLGLATSYSIVKRHDGHLDVTSLPGRGTSFCMHLPASFGAVEKAAPEAAPRRGQGRVLVMDDEPTVLQVAGAMLRNLGYEAVLAPDGAKAVELYRAALGTDRAFSAVILDLTVPGGQGGRETIRELHALDPGVRAVVSSGYSDDPVMAHYREDGFSGVMCKPYTIEMLGRTLNDLLAPPPA